jgi:hypothetical protein
MGLRRWIWAAVVVGSAGAARAEDVVLEGVEVRSGEECLEVLGEFGKVCQNFERPEWARAYGKPFWDLGQLLFYRRDIDLDGTDDGIVSIEGLPRCPRGGELCEHMVLFGEINVPDTIRILRTRMWGYPVLSSQNHEAGIYFNYSPDTFLSIDQVKDEMLTGPTLQP